MAVHSGTATDYLDLLDQVRSYVTSSGFLGTQAWTVKRWQDSGSDSGAENELILIGSGLAGTDEIYVGVSGFYSVGGDYYNWRLNGFTAYEASQAWGNQTGAIPLSSLPPILPSWNNPITYWLVANGRRIVLVTKVSTKFEAMYLGLLAPYATPGQYPLPLVVGGSMSGYNAQYRWSYEGTEHGHFCFPSYYNATNPTSMRLRKADGTWKCALDQYAAGAGYELHVYPHHKGNAASAPTRVGKNLDSQYTLFPMMVYEDPEGSFNCYGEFEGCYWVTGFDNSAENIITVSGVDYLVVQDVFRTGVDDYWALKLA